MFEQLIEQVRACYEHAADAKQKAEAATDPASKASFLDMEKRWLALAHSYLSIESLGELSDAIPDGRREPQERARVNDSLRLQEVSISIIQEGNLAALYDRVLDAAIALMSADMGSMQTFYPEQGELRLLAWRGFHPESAAFWERVHLDSACACGMALSLGRRIILPDTETCDSMAGTGDLDAYRRSNIRAVQSTPLVSRSGRLLGMISTHWREPHQPTERALRSLDILARQAADLIERTQIEAALRESEEGFRRLASIVESNDDAIVSTSLDGIITSWNKGAERILGYTAEEAVGKPVTILAPPDRQHEDRMITERIGRGERVEHFETVREHKDGSSIVISLTISPVKNSEGRIVGASKIGRDITERKLLEAREKVLIAELTYMNRVATAGELTASIAHEVNQPLTGIATKASAARRWLAAEKPDIGRVLDVLDQIETASYRASEIIANVRSMFSKGKHDKAEVDINKLIWTVVNLVSVDLRERRIELKMELDDQLPPVFANHVQLQQVILNLVMNAIEAMRSVQSRVLSVKSSPNGRNSVHVSVGDSGIGIDPANLNRIFERLFTTKENGMGMGLSICHSIIENHGGRIWVSPAVGRGSIFQFELPTSAA